MLQLLISTLIIISQSLSWQTMTAPSDIDIHKFTNYKDCFWAIDYGNGIILKSEDKGKNWTKTNEVGGEFLEKIQFLNYNEGYVSGDFGFVHKTIDGGKTWQEISPPVENRISENYEDDTTKNQKPDGVKAYYYDMLFLNTNEGYVSGFSYNPSKGWKASYQKIFWQTSDGGNTWSSKTNEEAKELKKKFQSNLKKKKNIVGLTYYLNPKTAWQIAATRDTTHIKRTVDGGKNWEKVLLPDPDVGSWMAREVIFLNKNQGFVFGGTIGENHEDAVIFESNDGGKSWAIFENDWPHVHDAKLINNEIWICGKKGMVMKTGKPINN